MEFTKDLTETLSIYNNNNLVFNPTNEVKAIIKCTLTIEEYEFEITPDSERNFKFNLKAVSKALLNDNLFKDTIVPDLEISNINFDDTLCKDLSVDFEILFDDDSTETETKVFKFFKSVKQIIRNEFVKDDRLFPMIKRNDLTYHLTFFEGYPFDIAIYSNDDRTIKIVNKTNFKEIEIDVVEGVNRFYISDGVTNSTLLDEFPIGLNINNLEFYIGAELIFNIILKQEDSTGGSYLKWFNESGSYSHWLFPNREKTDLRFRTISETDNDFEDVEDTSANFSITGKTKRESTSTISQLLSIEEEKYLEELLSSPKVELYNSVRHSINKDWVGVKIEDTSLSYNPKAIRNRIPVKIIPPNHYTQTT